MPLTLYFFLLSHGRFAATNTLVGTKLVCDSETFFNTFYLVVLRKSKIHGKPNGDVK